MNTQHTPPSNAELIEHARAVGMVEPERAPEFVAAFRAHVEERSAAAGTRPVPLLDGITAEEAAANVAANAPALTATGRPAAEEQPAPAMPGDLFTAGAIRHAAFTAAAAEATDAVRLFPDTMAFASTIGALEGLADRFRRMAAFHATVEQPTGLTWEARAEHATRLYATTAIELEDARRDVAKLRAERDDAERGAERYAVCINAARNLHTKHDSPHCKHDGERWPCPTVLALDDDQAEPVDATERPEDTARRFAHRLAAVERLCSGRPGYHTITVKQLLTAMSNADDDQADEQPPVPAVRDRYVKRNAPDAGRIVTVNRAWTAEAGHTAVAYGWPDPRASYAGSACPLDVFRREYRPEAGR